MAPRVITRHATPGALHGRRLPPASAVLGDNHPVTRASRLRHLLAGQLTVTSGLLAAATADVVTAGSAAAGLFSAAAVAELWFACGFAFASSRLHEHSRDVIADSDLRPAAAEIDAEHARLGSPRHRQQLARTLERALFAAEHWHELSITSRPPPTVRQLRACSGAAREVIELVRNPGTPVRGVALLDRLVCGGFSSVLYDGSPETLARELGRIRFLLQTTPGGV